MTTTIHRTVRAEASTSIPCVGRSQNRSSFPGLAAAIFGMLLLIATGARVCAADNPTPCTDPWTCETPPQVLITWNKTPYKICLGETATWEAIANVAPGTRKRCDETKQDVNAGTLSYTWVIKGPVKSSGSGSSVDVTPTKCGTYHIQFTASCTPDAPCDENGPVSGSTDNNEFVVPCEVCTASTSKPSWPVCPGNCVGVPITISNPDPDCAFTFSYDTELSNGPPKITVQNGSGFVTVPAGGSVPITVTFCADADSPGGTRVFTVVIRGTSGHLGAGDRDWRRLGRYWRQCDRQFAGNLPGRLGKYGHPHQYLQLHADVHVDRLGIGQPDGDVQSFRLHLLRAWTVGAAGQRHRRSRVAAGRQGPSPSPSRIRMAARSGGLRCWDGAAARKATIRFRRFWLPDSHRGLDDRPQIHRHEHRGLPRELLLDHHRRASRWE